jgi:bacterioferritin-associated ferredoxin
LVVCHCAVVTDHEVRDAIRAGATDVCALAEACGTARACGGCLPAIRQELDAHGLPTDDAIDARTIRARLRDRLAGVHGGHIQTVAS